MNQSFTADDHLLVTPEEAARRLLVGRTTVYALMASGELLSVNIGRCRRVPLSALRSFVTRLVDDKNSDRHHREYGGGGRPLVLGSALAAGPPAPLMGVPALRG